ncbi:MAG: asparagine synthase-related protein [Hyphomicrobiaceae bacterium]
MSFLVCSSQTGGLNDGEATGPLPFSIEGEQHLTVSERRRVQIRYTPTSIEVPFGASAESSPDQRLTLVGRIRLDRRNELTKLLFPDGGTPSDAALCLAAYDRWGPAFASYLHGDFGFVLWDEHAQRLVCARDRFGVRPLFWTQTDSAFVISDDLDKITTAIPFKRDLDALWILSFLTNNFSPPAEATVYSHINRVAPGTVLCIEGSRSTTTRYWQLEIGDPLFLPNSRAYDEAFRDSVTAALADRLDPGITGITMSGGLDSSSLAALSVAHLGNPSRIVTQTRVYQRLIDDQEEYYSGLIAKRLGVAHTVVPMDDTSYDPHWFEMPTTLAEPSDAIIIRRFEEAMHKDMAQRSRIWLYGEGPDNALTFEWRPYFRWLARQRRFGRLGIAIAQLIATTPQREWKLAWQRLSSFNRLWIDAPPPVPDNWLNPDFIDGTNYDHYCAEHYRLRAVSHPWRPRAFASLTSSIWPATLESMDPVLAKAPIDYRHPYLDTRVIEFLVRLPPVPQSRAKSIVRHAMTGLLPEEVLRRPKTPLVNDPLQRLVHERPLPAFKTESPIHAYVDTAKLEAAYREGHGRQSLLNAHVLDHWLTRRGYG